MHEKRPEAVTLTFAGDGTGRLAKGRLAILAGAIVVAVTVASLIGVGTGAAVAAASGITTSVTINGEQCYVAYLIGQFCLRPSSDPADQGRPWGAGRRFFKLDGKQRGLVE